MKHPFVQLLEHVSEGMKKEVSMETLIANALEHGLDPKQGAELLRKIIEVKSEVSVALKEIASRINAHDPDFTPNDTPPMDDVKIDETTKSYIISDVSQWPKQQGGSGGS